MGDGCYHRTVRRLTGPCCVEVDDVNPPRTRRGERCGDPNWVVSVDGLCGEVPFEKTNAKPAAKVDSGKEVHYRAARGAKPGASKPGASKPEAAKPAKLDSIARPTAPDFSGWNWVAQTE